MLALIILIILYNHYHRLIHGHHSHHHHRFIIISVFMSFHIRISFYVFSCPIFHMKTTGVVVELWERRGSGGFSWRTVVLGWESRSWSFCSGWVEVLSDFAVFFVCFGKGFEVLMKITNYLIYIMQQFIRIKILSVLLPLVKIVLKMIMKISWLYQPNVTNTIPSAFLPQAHKTSPQRRLHVWFWLWL